MKGRQGKGPPSSDLLVCFPSRAHLTLMPKPICSPARASESTRRRHHHHHSHQHHHLNKSIKRAGSAGQVSPLVWAKTKPTTSEIAEPTSPKVTCAGQIKVRHKPNSCKNWQSVMEEIEKLHNNRKQKKKKHTWAETLGFKKDIMQFLTYLRSIRLDFRCFGSFPSSDITSDDDDDHDDEDDDSQHNHTNKEAADDDNEASRTVFSKWFMVLQENQTKEFIKNQNKDTDASHEIDNEEGTDNHAPCAPPANALLLMRCRSAPAKSWLEEREEEDEEDEDEEEEENEDKKAQLTLEEEEKKRKDSLLVMRYNTDFSRFSTDIAKETWVVGGIKDPLSRSRSWKS